jgi:mono/diheme cytochrome c family protein
LRSILALLVVGIGIMMMIASPTTAQEGDEFEEDVLRGAVLYAQYCSTCHGAQGEAIAPGDAFAAISDYDPNFVRGRITNGYDSNIDNEIAMPGYGEDAGGPLSTAQIDDIIAYMETWNDPRAETPALPEPNIEPGPIEIANTARAEHGAVVYAYNCLGCHGVEAQGLGLENFPSFEPDNPDVISLVDTGDGHGIVPAFGETDGGPLSENDLTDLGTYLQTLEVEEEEESPEGVDILIIVLGLGAVLAVGGAYLAASRRSAA